MDKPLLIGAVVVVICGFLVFIVVSLMSGTMVMRDKIVNTTDDMTLGRSHLFGKSFRIVNSHYFNRSLAEDNATDPCVSGKEVVILSLLFNSSVLPDKCDIMMDDGWERSIAPAENGCNPRCNGDDILMAVDLRAQDAYAAHDIEVCCDSICLDNALSPICSKT